MAFTLYLKPNARKELNKLSAKERPRVLLILEDIKADPFGGKQLHGKRKGQYSVRVWPYRFVYTVNRNRLVIIVIGFGHRQGVYK